MDYGTAMKSQWNTDIMEVSNDDLQRAYIITGEVTQCGPYERCYAQGRNEWLEPTGSQPEMDWGRRWMAPGDGSRPDMDCDTIRMDDRRCITGDG